jgi:site-specific recombinase XerD
MNKSSAELRSLIQGFKFTCQTEGKSAKTIEWYSSFLDRFCRFLERSNLPTDLNHIDRNHVREFIRYLQTEARTPYKPRPLSGATVQGYVRTLKAFFSWATREGYIETNPVAMIPVPKAATKIVNTFTNEHIATLANMCSASNGNGCRNLTIILFLLDSGLRVSELVSLDLNDLNLNEGHTKVRRAKGNRERLVPIGSLVQKWLWKYINHYRPQPLTYKVAGLFLTDRGLPLTKSGIQQMMRRIGRRAGITGVRCSPHTFRHTFAKYYLLNGGDIFSLQKMLGHSSLGSVRVYLELFAVDVKRQHQRFSPVDNMAESRQIYPPARPTEHHSRRR